MTQAHWLIPEIILLYNSSLTQNEINDNDRQKLENILKRYGLIQWKVI